MRLNSSLSQKLQDEDLSEETVTESNNVLLSPEIILDKIIRDDFSFPIDNEDILFTLTFNPSIYKENVGNLISKMAVIKELSYVNLDDFAKVLAILGIKGLNIFSINKNLEETRTFIRNNGCYMRYTEIKPNDFISILKLNKADFSDYNINTLYILRSGGFI